MCGETLDFHYVSISNGNIKMPDWKIIVNLLLKLFNATVVNADAKRQMSLNTLFDTGTYLDHMLVKFELNRMVQNVKKMSFLTKI